MEARARAYRRQADARRTMPASMTAGDAVYESRMYSVQDPSTVMELPGRIRTPSRAANCAKDVASPNGSRTHRHSPPDGLLNCHCGKCSARRWQIKSQLSSSWRRRNVAIWSNDSRTRKARTCEGTDVPRSVSTFSRAKRAAMLAEARIQPTWIPGQKTRLSDPMDTTFSGSKYARDLGVEPLNAVASREHSSTIGTLCSRARFKRVRRACSDITYPVGL